MDGTVSLCTVDGTVPSNTESSKNKSLVLRVNIALILTYNHEGLLQSVLQLVKCLLSSVHVHVDVR